MSKNHNNDQNKNEQGPSQGQSWTDEQIKEVMGMDEVIVTVPKEVVTPHSELPIEEKQLRNLLLIGCGDGGCNIAMKITEMVPEAKFIAYNTSPRAMKEIQASFKIIPAEEDGSGKAREYSKNIFKNSAYDALLKAVNTVIPTMPDLAYIVVTTTCDGGTGGGVSPMIAKFVSDNTKLPVIMVGVYPTLLEDSVSQFNAMSWQQDMEKVGLPYIIFDNDANRGMPTAEVHNTINKEIALAMRAISGKDFGATNIASIDSRDMLMLLNRIGGRINIFASSQRPGTTETLDEYIMKRISSWSCLLPENVRGVGLFLKAPADYISRTETSLAEFSGKYGVPEIRYTHLEEGDDFQVALICSGCGEAIERIRQMRQRYDDIQAARKSTANVASGLLNGLSSPFDIAEPANTSLPDGKPDLSALDL